MRLRPGRVDLVGSFSSVGGVVSGGLRWRPL